MQKNTINVTNSVIIKPTICVTISIHPFDSMRNPTHKIIVEGDRRRTKIENDTWKYKDLGLKNYLIGCKILEDGFLWVEGGGDGEETHGEIN